MEATDSTMSDEFTPLNFYRFLAEGKLMGSRCRTCGRPFLPPRPICGLCQARDMEWVEFPPIGKLAAYTSISVAPSLMLHEGHNRANPYCTGVVELAGSLRISARILGVDAAHPQTIVLGTPVTLEGLRDGQGKVVVAFRAAVAGA